MKTTFATILLMLSTSVFAASFTPQRANTVTIGTNNMNGTYVAILAAYTNAPGITLQEFLDNILAGSTQHFHYGIFHNGLLVSNGLAVSGGATVNGGLIADTVTAGTGTFYRIDATNGSFTGTLSAQDLSINGNLYYTNSAVSNLFFGYPRITITTNMFSSDWPSGTGNEPVTNSTFLYAFDGGTGTWTSAATITNECSGSTRCSLGARYRGLLYVEGLFGQVGATGNAVLLAGTAPQHYSYTANEPIPLSTLLRVELSSANSGRFSGIIPFDNAANVYFVIRRNNGTAASDRTSLTFSRIEVYGVAVP